jgi:hypothetical protein
MSAPPEGNSRTASFLSAFGRRPKRRSATLRGSAARQTRMSAPPGLRPERRYVLRNAGRRFRSVRERLDRGLASVSRASALCAGAIPLFTGESKLCARPSTLCAGESTLFAVATSLCAGVSKLCAVASSLCVRAGKLCAVDSSLFALASSLCAAMSTLCARAADAACQ